MEIFLPERFRGSFEVVKMEEKNKEWSIEVMERKSMVPKGLEGRDWVLNGYERSVEIIDFPFRGKPVYFTFSRRRWKERGGSKSYSNEYEFHRPGMKTTDEFGDFLKGLTRSERCEYFCTFKDIRHIREEDF